MELPPTGEESKQDSDCKDGNSSDRRDDPPSYSAYQQSRALTRDSPAEIPSTNELHRWLSVSTESDLSSIGDDYDVASITSSIDDKLTWRGRMQHILHSKAVVYSIIILVLLDALIVLIEFLLDVGAFDNIHCRRGNILEIQEFCHYSPDSRDTCAPPALLVLQNISIQPRGAPLDRELCHCGFKAGKLVCLPESESSGLKPAIIFHGLSLTILTIFMFEVILRMIVFHFKNLKHRFELLDTIVVIISWTLDVASIIEEEAFEVVSLVIVLCLWRIIRIVNASLLAAQTRSDNKLQKAKRKAQNIIHAYHKTQDINAVIKNENMRLRKLLEGTGIIVDPTPSALTPTKGGVSIKVHTPHTTVPC